MIPELCSQALTLMNELVYETKDMATGRQPSAPKVIQILTQLCRIHMQLTQEQNRFRTEWWGAERKRKREYGEQYVKIRERGKKVKDSEIDAYALVGDELDKEKQVKAAYLDASDFLDSIRNATDAARTVQSYIRSAESLPSQ